MLYFFLHHILLVGVWRHRNIFINASLLISERRMQHLTEPLNGEFLKQCTAASSKEAALWKDGQPY